MTDEPIDWKALINAANSPESVAWLYKHAETYLRHTDFLPDIANKLGKVFHASKNNRLKNPLHLTVKSEKTESHRIEFVSTEGRAIDICSAIGLNTKTGRRALPPTAEQLMASGLPDDLAHFIAERFKAAKNAAATAQNAKYRARAVTAALRLKHPVGALPAAHRCHAAQTPQKTILVRTTSALLGEVTAECFDDAVQPHPAIPPAVLVAAIDAAREFFAFYDSDPKYKAPLPSIRAICQKVADRFGRDQTWVESIYYREKQEVQPVKNSLN